MMKETYERGHKSQGVWLEGDDAERIAQLLEEHVDREHQKDLQTPEERFDQEREITETQELMRKLRRPNASNHSRHSILDLVKQESDQQCYRDYESLMDPQSIQRIKFLTLKWSRDVDAYKSHKLTSAIRDMAANILLEIAEFDEENPLPHPTNTTYTIWDDRASNIIHTLTDLLTVGHWTRSGVDWDKAKRKYQKADLLPPDITNQKGDQ